MITPQQSFDRLLDCLKETLQPPPSSNETLRAMLERAPKTSESHRIAATACRCSLCKEIMELTSLQWEFHSSGRPDSVCPFCGANNQIAVMEEPQRGGSS